jgi:uncharacterized protein
VTRIFVDTSAWCAIEDKDDIHHSKALQFKDAIAGTCVLVTTNYVLDETYTLLLLNIGYQKTIEFHRTIEQMSRARILHIEQISKALDEETWTIFERFNTDKEWSFTDCSSYVAMKQLEIREVFAFDHHFEQMSFVRKP